MTKPFHLIGLTGPASSGKDTVADILVKHAGFYKLAFADALKTEVCDAFGIEPLYLTHRDTKEHPMSALCFRKCQSDSFTASMFIQAQERGEALDMNKPRSPREIMQMWGTEYRRKQRPSYWTSKLTERIRSTVEWGTTNNRFVVTDVRFEDEAATVTTGYGGQLWQVKRPGFAVAPGAHVSETTGEVFNPTTVIHNTADINADPRPLQAQVLGAFWAHDAGLKNITVTIGD